MRLGGQIWQQAKPLNSGLEQARHAHLAQRSGCEVGAGWNVELAHRKHPVQTCTAPLRGWVCLSVVVTSNTASVYRTRSVCLCVHLCVYVSLRAIPLRAIHTRTFSGGRTAGTSHNLPVAPRWALPKLREALERIQARCRGMTVCFSFFGGRERERRGRKKCKR